MKLKSTYMRPVGYDSVYPRVTVNEPTETEYLCIGWSLVELDEEREQVGIGKKNLSAMTHSFLTRPVRRTEMYFNVDEKVNVRFHECGVAPVNPFYSGDWDKKEDQVFMLDPDVRVSIFKWSRSRGCVVLKQSNILFL